MRLHCKSIPLACEAYMGNLGLKHTSFRPAESCASAIRPARAGDESRDHVSGAGFGDGVSPQKRQKAVELVRLNRRFIFKLSPLETSWPPSFRNPQGMAR